MRDLWNSKLDLDQLFDLDLFLDLKKLLRVKGQIQNAHLRFNKSHPIIMPSRLVLVRQLVEFGQELTIYSGVQMMRSYVGGSVWIIKRLRLFQNVYRRCCIYADFAGLCNSKGSFASCEGKSHWSYRFLRS